MTVWLGWLGQIAYFGRSTLQWLGSERARRSIVPRGYWELSLVGALLLGSYALLRQDPVILLGQIVNGAIYLRNLVLLHRPPQLPLRRRVMVLLALMVLTAVFTISHDHFTHTSGLFGLAGWLGQTLLLCRFPAQWWQAERSGRQELPGFFWYSSFFGSLLLLGYAASRQDMVILTGQGLGLFMYGRNIWLLHRPHAAQEAQS